jgi:flagellar hook-associated protein 3 FlgL
MTNVTNRVSSFAVHSNLLKDVMRTQSSIYDFQNQLSSGLKSTTYSGIAGSVEMFTDLGAKVRRADRYIENITIATTRLNTINRSLDDVVQQAENMKALMTQWRSVDSKNINATPQFLQAQQALGAALNVSMEGRYLFGGTKTNTAPVDTNFQPPVTFGVADAGYYNGSTENMTFRAQETYEFSYNVRADNPALQKIFTAISMGIQADGEQSDEKMVAALDMLSEGLKEVLAVQAEVNVNVLGLKDIAARHEATQTYYRGLTDDVIKTDIVEVSTKVAYHQTIIQASYQAFAAINSLKLADYLR